MYVLVRVFLKESEEVGGRPLYTHLVDSLRRRGIGGATVLKAMLGYGTTGEYHYEGIEALSYDLPVVVEFVEEEAKALEALRDMEDLLKDKLIVLEEAKVWA